VQISYYTQIALRAIIRPSVSVLHLTQLLRAATTARATEFWI